MLSLAMNMSSAAKINVLETCSKKSAVFFRMRASKNGCKGEKKGPVNGRILPLSVLNASSI